jgi:ribonuclease D
MAVVDNLKPATVVGGDTETTSLTPGKGRVRLLQVAIPGYSAVVDCFKVGPTPLLNELKGKTIISSTTRRLI